MPIVVRIRLSALLGLQVSLRRKLVRVLEVLAVVVDGPQVAQDRGARGDEVAVVVVVLDARVRCAAHNSHRPPPQRLLDDGSAVRQVRFVAPRRRSIAANDTVELLLRLCRDFRETRHGEHKAHERGRGRITAGAEKGSGGIGNLALRELARVLVEPLPEVLGERRGRVAVVHASPHVLCEVEEEPG